MSEQGYGRRQFLHGSGALALGGLAGCVGRLSGSGGEAVEPPTPVSGTPDTSIELTASEGTVQPGPETSSRTWMYDGQLPGPTLRAQEGDIVGITVRNDLPAETTVHWHGVPVRNPVDGVPGLTQAPIAPGDSFEYRFRADPAGTYFYHSHVGLQLDRGLLGPLVIESPDPHVAYDREYVVVFDDYLGSEPQPLSDRVDGGGGMGSGGMGGRMGDDVRPPYRGLLVNGRLPASPPSFAIAEGDRVRFRFINAASATIFGVNVAGHGLTVTHADGQPVEPVEVDSFVFGAGERYDAVLDATNPGRWALQARALDGAEPPATAAIEYEGADDDAPVQSPSSTGRRLGYGDLRAVSQLDGVNGSPDRTFDLTLSRGPGEYVWTIDGQAFPDADPLLVSPGDHVRVRLTNHSPVPHPMHLHGHFFQVGDAVKDTVLVPGHMGQVVFDFVADNPGQWLFHCHNLYHLHAGMARVIRYVE